MYTVYKYGSIYYIICWWPYSNGMHLPTTYLQGWIEIPPKIELQHRKHIANYVACDSFRCSAYFCATKKTHLQKQIRKCFTQRVYFNTKNIVQWPVTTQSSQDPVIPLLMPQTYVFCSVFDSLGFLIPMIFQVCFFWQSWWGWQCENSFWKNALQEKRLKDDIFLQGTNISPPLEKEHLQKCFGERIS